MRTWFGEVRRERWGDTAWGCSTQLPDWARHAGEEVRRSLEKGCTRIVVEMYTDPRGQYQMIEVDSEQPGCPVVPWSILLWNLWARTWNGTFVPLQIFFHNLFHRIRFMIQ